MALAYGRQGSWLLCPGHPLGIQTAVCDWACNEVCQREGPDWPGGHFGWCFQDRRGATRLGTPELYAYLRACTARSETAVHCCPSNPWGGHQCKDATIREHDTHTHTHLTSANRYSMCLLCVHREGRQSNCQCAFCCCCCRLSARLSVSSETETCGGVGFSGHSLHATFSSSCLPLKALNRLRPNQSRPWCPGVMMCVVHAQQ